MELTKKKKKLVSILQIELTLSNEEGKKNREFSNIIHTIHSMGCI